MVLLPFLGTLVASSPAAPPELGTIHWLRDFDAAIAASKSSKKPLLVLFDEVPGCQTVLAFGKEVLSHPEIAKIAEREFVPVAIYNNTGGTDREILQSFKEPAWNNPVVRIIDHERRALAPRFAGDYTVRALATNMVTALRAVDRTVPSDLLKLAGIAAAPENAREKATFSMYCFWECEARLGEIDGVVAARVGYLHGEEVVEVEFDATAIDRKTLIERARKQDCARTVYTRSEAEEKIARSIPGVTSRLTEQPLAASPKDEKYYLARSKYRDVPMTETQALRVNAALRFGRDPEKALR